MLITDLKEHYVKRYQLQARHFSCAIEGLDHCEVYQWIFSFHFFFVVHAVSANDNDWKLDPSWKLFAILFPDGLIMGFYKGQIDNSLPQRETVGYVICSKRYETLERVSKIITYINNKSYK